VIKTFRCRDAQALFDGRRVARFADLERIAMRKLQQIHAASELNLQAHYDTELAKERLGTEFLAEIRRHAVPA
jgi:plasmid maintenance system killer protein